MSIFFIYGQSPWRASSRLYRRKTYVECLIGQLERRTQATFLSCMG